MHSADCSAPLISLQGRIGWQQLPFAFAWHQPMQKVITRTFWMGRTGYRGSWVIPPHQTWEPLYIISEKCSFLKKKCYVYTQQTCNICSWDILQKDWHLSYYVISDRGRNSSLWSVYFMQFFQRASTGSLKNPVSVFVITSPLPAGRVWRSEQVSFHCPFLKRVCIYCTPSCETVVLQRFFFSRRSLIQPQYIGHFIVIF